MFDINVKTPTKESSMTTLSQTINEINTKMLNGDRSVHAIRDAETKIIKEFAKKRAELLDAMAYQVARYSRQRDMSTVMKLFHAAKNVLEARAEKTNADLATIASGVSNPKFIWTSKVQQPLVVRVELGDQSGMTGEAGRETEYKGFEGDEIVTFFMSQKKNYWGQRAGRFILGMLMNELGISSYKELWSTIGQVSFGAALFQEYASYEMDEHGCHVVVTDKLIKMKNDLKEKEQGLSATNSNHYNEVSADEIREYEKRLDDWESKYEIWQGKVGKLVAEYNATNEWAGLEIRLPVGELQDMHQWQRQSTVEGLQQAAIETAEFTARLQTKAEEAEAAFQALFK